MGGRRPGGRAAGRPGGRAAGQAGQASNHKPPQNVIVHFFCLNDAVVGGQLSMFIIIIIMFNILKQYSKTHVIRLQRYLMPHLKTSLFFFYNECHLDCSSSSIKLTMY